MVPVFVAVLAQPLLLVKEHSVVSYNEPNTAAYWHAQNLRAAVARWLGDHYDHGLILMSTFKGADRIILDSGLPDRAFVQKAHRTPGVARWRTRSAGWCGRGAHYGDAAQPRPPAVGIQIV